MRTLWLSVALFLAPSAQAQMAPRLYFTVDPRVELLSAVLELAAPDRAEGPPPSAYRDALRLHFSPFSGHPAVLRARGLTADRQPDFLGVLLRLPYPLRVPEDAAARELPGWSPDWAAFLAELADFSERSGFPGYFETQRRFYTDLVRLAEKEAEAAPITPEELHLYLGRPLTEPYHYVLAPALPRRFTTTLRHGGEQLQTLSPWHKGSRLFFRLDEFANSPAHDAAHTAINPLVLEMFADAGFKPARPPPSDCSATQDSWADCLQEYLVDAVTLRILEAKAGRRTAQRTARQLIKSGQALFPRLEILLRSYEADRADYPSFDRFFPLIARDLRRALEGPAANSKPASRRITAGLDPVIELAAAAQLLASVSHRFEGFIIHPQPSVAAARRRFAPWQGHPVVRLTAQVDERLPAVPRLQLLAQTPAPAALRAGLGIDPDRISAPGGLQGWLDALWDLASASRFSEYFAEEQARLAPEIKEVQARLDAFDHTGLIEAYTGLTFKGTYRLILSPYCEPGAPASVLAGLDDGSYALFTVSGPKDAPSPDQPSFLADDLHGPLFHELGHGLFDDLSGIHQEELSRTAPLRGELKLGRYNAGMSWEQRVREHLVRAVKNRLILRSLGEKAAARDLAMEVGDGFVLLPRFIARLDEYEADRRKYPNLARFYGRWLTVLDEELRAKGLAPAAETPTDPGEAERSDTPGAAQRAQALVDILAAGGETRWLSLQEALRQKTAARAAEDDRRRAQDAEVARLTAIPQMKAQEPPKPAPAVKKEDPRRAAALRDQQRKDYRRARETLAQLLKEEPGRADLLADLGLCEHLAGDAPSALDHLRQAVARDADFLPAYLTLGAVLTSLGQVLEADAVYQSALARPEKPGQEGLRALLKDSRAAAPR